MDGKGGAKISASWISLSMVDRRTGVNIEQPAGQPGATSLWRCLLVPARRRLVHHTSQWCPCGMPTFQNHETRTALHGGPSLVPYIPALYSWASSHRHVSSTRVSTRRKPGVRCTERTPSYLAPLAHLDSGSNHLFLTLGNLVDCGTYAQTQGKENHLQDVCGCLQAPEANGSRCQWV